MRKHLGLVYLMPSLLLFAQVVCRYKVKAFPTIIAFAGGKEVARHVGLTTKEKLLRLVDARA